MTQYRNWDKNPPRSENEHDQMCHEKAYGIGYFAPKGRRGNRSSSRRRSGSNRSNWSEPMGGSDNAGNEITVAFGSGPAKGETLLGDGDKSESDFMRSENHDHYGSGSGPNDNGTKRGRYTGSGH